MILKVGAMNVNTMFSLFTQNPILFTVYLLSKQFPFIVCRYGDKTPRSFIGRLFGVLWILLGLIVTTMFIATVTSALQHSSTPEFINALEGMEVSLITTLKGKT